MDLDSTIDDLEVRDPEPEVLLGFLTEMEFRTQIKRAADKLGVQAPSIPEPVGGADDAPAADDVPFDASKYEWVKDRAALDRWIAAIMKRGYVAVDTETNSLNEMVAELAGICLSVEPGEACYIPVGHKKGASDDLFGGDELQEGQMPLNEVLDALKPMLEDASVLKIFQNAKYDCKVFANYNVTVAPIDDTMLLSYALHAGEHNHGMDALSERYLSHQPVPIKTLIGSGKSMITFDKVPIEDALPYAAEDADVTLRLWKLFKPKLHRRQVTSVYETLERPLVPVLAQMERHGVLVDRDTLSRMSNAFAQKMAALEAEIHELAGGYL
jgi:DNA polymerase-1